MNQKQRVLAIDDEARNLKIIAETIEDLVDLQMVASGEEALAVLEEHAPDLVLLDIMMPGIDGYEVCRQIKSNPRLKYTKVILISGKAIIEERLKGYSVDTDDYMTKPFAPEELLAKVKVFLRLAKMERELSELNESLDQQVQKKTQELTVVQATLVNSSKLSALGEMAGGLAHEVNTPLNIIGLVAEQLQELVATPSFEFDDANEKLNLIRRTVKKIDLIIQSLRTFSRDGSQDDCASWPVKDILESTLVLCREKLKDSSIDLQVDSFSSDLLVQCRSVQISQVLLNLISNAYDALTSHSRSPSKSDRWIKISVQSRDSQIEIAIMNSGPGIPPEIQEKMFQPFFTTKEIGSGPGLGLSVAKGIVATHQGQLFLDPECPHPRFVLTLPKGS